MWYGDTGIFKGAQVPLEVRREQDGIGYLEAVERGSWSL